MDVIDKNEETRLKINISRKRYYHTHEEYRNNKNRKDCERFALRYRTDPEFRKKLLIQRHGLIMKKN